MFLLVIDLIFQNTCVYHSRLNRRYDLPLMSLTLSSNNRTIPTPICPGGGGEDGAERGKGEHGAPAAVSQRKGKRPRHLPGKTQTWSKPKNGIKLFKILRR